MNLLRVLLPALLASLAAAETSDIADCLIGAVNNGNDAGTESNFAKLKEMGELAFVGRDPGKKEVDLTCFVVNLKPDLTYELRYKDKDGVVMRVNGTYQDKRDRVPIIGNENAWAELDLPTDDLLNGGTLHPIVFVENEVIFQTCRRTLVAGIRSTYVAVPLSKAIANSANEGCGGCDDWSSI